MSRLTVAALSAVVLVVVGLLAFMTYAALRDDEVSDARERETVRAFLAAHTAHMMQALKMAVASVPATSAPTAMNAAWFERAFGRPLNDGFGFEQSFLVSRNGEVLYATAFGKTLDGSALEAVRPALERLARDAASRSGVESGVLVQGRLTGLAAVQPLPAQAADHEPVLAVTVDLIDDNLLRELGGGFKPDGFKVEDQQARPSENSLSVTNLADGRPLSIAWPAERPGHALLARLAPPVALVSTAMFALCAAFLVHARRTGRALAASEGRAKVLAAQDSLTGLSNRAHFIAELERAVTELREGETLALMFLDLDGFKDINDTLGHAAGDALLCEVAARLRSCIGDTGLVARFGGDEFVLMLSPDALARLPALLEDLLACVRAPMAVDGGELRVSASIGAAMAPVDAATGRELMRLADIALYRAKADGRGGAVRFEPYFEREVRRRRNIELELMQAVESDQLALVFQPQVDVESERIVGFEALLRWDHPRRGRLMPGDFLAVAEGTPLITRIDAWVLRNACIQAQAFGDVTLAVNMSPISLRSANMADRVIQALEETGFDPHRLEIEITESAIIGSDPEVQEALTRLRTHGVRLALDDFGTGHASLVHVRRFPITKIKIDRSFIVNLGIERDAASIVEYVVRLGRSLGITLTAEGVETREQLRFLRAFGAQQAQGFLFSSPLPLPAALALLQSNREMLAGARRTLGRDGARHPS